MNQNKNKINSISPMKSPYSSGQFSNANLQPLSKDKFVKQNNPANSPSFTGIPIKEIMELSEKALKDIKVPKDADGIYAVAEKYINDFTKIMNSPKNKSSEDSYLIPFFRHEILAKIGNNINFHTSPYFREISYPEVNDAVYTGLQKTNFGKIVKIFEDSTQRFSTLENWYKNKDLTVPITDVKAQLKDALSSYKALNNMENKVYNRTFENTPESQIHLKNLSLLKEKNVKNPFQLYNIFSQVLLNAEKYGQGKPIDVKISTETINGTKKYFATITNLETKAIPDNEINEILKGSGYRTSSAKETNGTGTGYKEIINTLKENGMEDEIPNLIEKGRNKGFSVRIPLIGVS